MALLCEARECFSLVLVGMRWGSESESELESDLDLAGLIMSC
jgi:hypothetical protein